MTIDKLTERKIQNNTCDEYTITRGDVDEVVVKAKTDSDWVEICDVNDIHTTETDFYDFDEVRSAVESVTTKDDRFIIEEIDGEFVLPFPEPIGDISTDRFPIEKLNLHSGLSFDLHSSGKIRAELNYWRPIGDADDVDQFKEALPSNIRNSLLRARDDRKWIVQYDNKEEAFVVPLDDPFETVEVMDVYGEDAREEDRNRVEEESGYDLVDLTKEQLRMDSISDETVGLVDEDASKFNSLIRTCNEEVLNDNWTLKEIIMNLLLFAIILSFLFTLISEIEKFADGNISISFLVAVLGTLYTMLSLYSSLFLFGLGRAVLDGLEELDEFHYKEEFTVS
jgi:hypothetical protein